MISVRAVPASCHMPSLVRTHKFRRWYERRWTGRVELSHFQLPVRYDAHGSGPERESVWKVVFVPYDCADRNGVTGFLRKNEHFRFTYRRRLATCCTLSGTFPLTYQAWRPSQDYLNIYTLLDAAPCWLKGYPWHHLPWNLWISLYSA